MGVGVLTLYTTVTFVNELHVVLELAAESLELATSRSSRVGSLPAVDDGRAELIVDQEHA